MTVTVWADKCAARAQAQGLAQEVELTAKKWMTLTMPAMSSRLQTEPCLPSGANVRPCSSRLRVPSVRLVSIALVARILSVPEARGAPVVLAGVHNDYTSTS